MNPVVRKVIGEGADDFDAKQYLMSMPQEYDGYKVHISADPMFWNEASWEQCLLYAKKMAEMLTYQFPGIETDVSLNPNTFPSGGEDAEVLELIDSWINDHFVEAIRAVEGN